MFGMHIGNVLSGLDIRNVNMDLKMLSLPVFCVKNGSKMGQKWVKNGSKMGQK